jgi:integrase
MGGEDAVRIHDFRRTVASRLLDEVVNDRVLKSVLNHHSGDVTSIYARASFDTQAKALQKLADGLFGQEVHVSDVRKPIAIASPSYRV